jgi:hypothetical protein
LKAENKISALDLQSGMPNLGCQIFIYFLALNHDFGYSGKGGLMVGI